MGRWHLTARPTLTLTERLRVLFGVPLYVRFTSPDGNCHAACHITASVQREWPDDDLPGGYPPLVRPLPPAPPPPAPPPNSRVQKGMC